MGIYLYKSGTLTLCDTQTPNAFRKILGQFTSLDFFVEARSLSLHKGLCHSLPRETQSNVCLGNLFSELNARHEKKMVGVIP